jgi:hypothetical protein
LEFNQLNLKLHIAFKDCKPELRRHNISRRSGVRDNFKFLPAPETTVEALPHKLPAIVVTGIMSKHSGQQKYI